MFSTREEILSALTRLMQTCPGNVVDLPTEQRTVTIFETPLVGSTAANDPLFLKYKLPEVIGPEWMSPEEWLPGAKSVVSFFFPFTDEIRSSERAVLTDETSEAWLYARIEGQAFLESLMENLAAVLTDSGLQICVPMLDPRFGTIRNVVPRETDQRFGTIRNVVPGKDEKDLKVVSAWSERHAAFACGLGTFGMSRGIITEKGMAGRFTSFVTDAEIPSEGRPYTDIYEYCIRCGACSRRCPVNAIPEGEIKNNLLCSGRMDDSKKRYAPRYGCGKCQTCVPCESRNPSRAKEKE